MLGIVISIIIFITLPAGLLVFLYYVAVFARLTRCAKLIILQTARLQLVVVPFFFCKFLCQEINSRLKAKFTQVPSPPPPPSPHSIT